jgi:hypothetical protein
MTSPERPTLTDEVRARFRAYHAKNPAWGALHIALDDGNVRDCSIDFCIGEAQVRGDAEGEALARLLRAMTKTQRLKVGKTC